MSNQTNGGGHVPQHESAAFAAASAHPGQRIKLFTPRSVGAALETARRELIACGEELQASTPFQGRAFFDDLLRELRSLTCRIAIIGQVKAGKSSFINAFVGRPELLPTDVNPWTTAVTHLHFGCADAPPNVAAQFTFFDSDEWERLARGDGPIRELTQRLVPDFEAELLQKHVDAMRHRSEQRLGSALDDLLGKRHAFSSLSAELLDRYVCSGAPGMPGAPTEHKGIYSDIVKSADLYFGTNDFGVPTTIIDTPGTNDPLLVRDEITRRALETADIYIVVLTARQALSSADVALLRILRGLHKDCIAVFINRIDELGDVSRDTQQIVQHVRAGLRREFPTADIPIVAGSALWAKAAVAGSNAEIDRMVSKKVVAYAAQFVQPANARTPSSAGELRNGQLAQTLLMCSGFSALADVLADLALHSHAGHVLKQACRSFTELGQVGRSATHQAVEILETEQKASLSRQQKGEEELRTIDAEVRRNEQLTQALQDLMINLQASTDQAIEVHYANMRESLRNEVGTFTEIECDNLRRAIADGHRGRTWTAETMSLRQRLEECFVDAYRLAEHEVAEIEANVFPKLELLLIQQYPQWNGRGEVNGEATATELPSLRALSQVVALDLGEPWWRRWWTSRSDGEGQIAELEQMIKGEFNPIVDALAQAGHAHLKILQSSALQKSTLIYMGLVEFLQEQNRARLARTRVLHSAGDALRKAEVQRNRQARVAELVSEIPVIEGFLRRLERMDRTWGERTS